MTMFTSQHYKAIADVLSACWGAASTGVDMRRTIIRRLADTFEADNPSFKRDLFIEYASGGAYDVDSAGDKPQHEHLKHEDRELGGD